MTANRSFWMTARFPLTRYSPSTSRPGRPGPHGQGSSKALVLLVHPLWDVSSAEYPPHRHRTRWGETRACASCICWLIPPQERCSMPVGESQHAVVNHSNIFLHMMVFLDAFLFLADSPFSLFTFQPLVHFLNFVFCLVFRSFIYSGCIYRAH